MILQATISLLLLLLLLSPFLSGEDPLFFFCIPRRNTPARKTLLLPENTAKLGRKNTAEILHAYLFFTKNIIMSRSEKKILWNLAMYLRCKTKYYS